MEMQKRMARFVGVAAVGCAMFVGAGTASAQHHHHHHSGGGGGNIANDFSRVINDSARLNQDYRQLNRDAANGNILGEINDLARISRDQSRLTRDVNRLNYDVNPAGYNNGGYVNGGYVQNGNSLIPSTTNPGYYYYANNPNQLYYYPNQQNVQQVQQVAAQAIPQATLSAPVNPVPQVFQTVRISNPASTAVELRFLFGGKEFSAQAGEVKEFQIASPTLIVFSRGGQLGEARYTLSGGSSFEFKYDNAGWSMVTKAPDIQVATGLNGSSLPPNPIPPSTGPQPVPLATNR